PYTKALAETILKPGLGILDAFNEVGVQVESDTGGLQHPWVEHSPIAGSFYFAAPGTAVASSGGPAADEIAWGYLKSTTDVAALRRFTVEFPRGRHKDEADALIAKLDQGAAPQKVGPPPKRIGP